jgi:hypothetical protein
MCKWCFCVVRNVAIYDVPGANPPPELLPPPEEKPGNPDGANPAGDEY